VSPPDNSDPEAQKGDIRSPQINYYIGIAYDALGKKTKAKPYYILSTYQSIRETNYIRYYQGLSYLKLGNKEKASEYFNSLIEEGNKLINLGS
jgi:tetratricopeptide (TPR) repeat protein